LREAEAICSRVAIIGLGIVPPEIVQLLSYSDMSQLTYAGVSIKKALAMHTCEEALTCRRKFRKYFRLACKWMERDLLRIKERTLDMSRRPHDRRPSAALKARAEARYLRSVERFRRSVCLPVRLGDPADPMTPSKMRRRKDLVIAYLLAQKN